MRLRSSGVQQLWSFDEKKNPLKMGKPADADPEGGKEGRGGLERQLSAEQWTGGQGREVGDPNSIPIE